MTQTLRFPSVICLYLVGIVRDFCSNWGRDLPSDQQAGRGSRKNYQHHAVLKVQTMTRTSYCQFLHGLPLVI